jgi:hypothetical protein
MAFIARFRQKQDTAKEEFNTEKVSRRVPNEPQDENGLMLAPSCVSNCFTRDSGCTHDNLIRVGLNNVGKYVVFPSLWWHHGYFNIYSQDKIFFTVQLFAT